MPNIFKRDQTRPELDIPKPLHQTDILPKTIKQKHIDGIVIKFGLEADRPDGSSHVKAYFSTDTDTLSLWNGSAWVTTTLT